MSEIAHSTSLLFPTSSLLFFFFAAFRSFFFTSLYETDFAASASRLLPRRVSRHHPHSHVRPRRRARSFVSTNDMLIASTLSYERVRIQEQQQSKQSLPHRSRTFCTLTHTIPSRSVPSNTSPMHHHPRKKPSSQYLFCHLTSAKKKT